MQNRFFWRLNKKWQFFLVNHHINGVESLNEYVQSNVCTFNYWNKNVSFFLIYFNQIYNMLNCITLDNMDLTLWFHPSQFSILSVILNCGFPFKWVIVFQIKYFIKYNFISNRHFNDFFFRYWFFNVSEHFIISIHYYQLYTFNYWIRHIVYLW